MIKYIAIILTILLSTLGIYKLGIFTDAQPVSLISSNKFRISNNIKRLAIMGCTPHPSSYLEKNIDKKISLKNLKLKDFLDIQDLEDSLEQLIKCCMDNQADHLLIAHLPIHYVKLKEMLGNNFIKEMTYFLNSIGPEMKEIVTKVKNKLKYEKNITIILPAKESLAKIPNHELSYEDRILYLIKQFPRFLGINYLDKIIIINNKGSRQNDGLINYLKYEYLFEKPIKYEIASLNKERFYKYL